MIMLRMTWSVVLMLAEAISHFQLFDTPKIQGRITVKFWYGLLVCSL